MKKTDCYLDNRAGAAARELDRLRAENARLRREFQKVRELSGREETYAATGQPYPWKPADGQW